MRSRGSRALFVADCTALDFLNSADRSRSDELDWMSGGEMLVSWLDQAELVPRAILRRLQRDSGRTALDRVAARARDLREWLGGFVSKHRGAPLAHIDPSKLSMLNRILAEDEKYSQITALRSNGSTTSLQTLRRWVSAESLLWPIAEAVAHMICEEDFRRIKACEGCRLVFVDRTRRQARKWCSMSTCGNRAKQAAHRGRQGKTAG